ncbi:MAG: hypothetical protein IPK55_15455 [Streptococcus sp.]|nr:hypothetical protein [Streptococcus sp.]
MPCPGTDQQSIQQLLGPLGKIVGMITSVTCIQVDQNKTLQVTIGFDVKTVNPLAFAPPNKVCVSGFRVQGNSYDVLACTSVHIPKLQPQIFLLETDKIITSCSQREIQLKCEGLCGMN